jgi:hypothetical protein
VVKDNPAALENIVSSPPFAGARGVGLLDYLGLRLHEWLDALLGALLPSGAPAGVWRLAQGLLIALAAAVVALIVTVGARGILETLVAAPTQPADPLRPDAGLDASGARHRAGELASRGAYREAVRYQFLAMVLDLDARDLVRLDTAAADRDLVRQARRRDGLLGNLLAEAARRFEAAWFGHHPCGAADYADMEGLAGRLAARAEAAARDPQRGPR